MASCFGYEESEFDDIELDAVAFAAVAGGSRHLVGAYR